MLKNRLALIEMFRSRDFMMGAEVGVFDGYFSEFMCQTIPGLTLYSIDPWEVYQGYRDHKFVASMQAAEAKARKRLEPFDCTIIKKFSMDAVKDFEDEFFDFVYIDANHEYKYVKEDIEEWAKKVRPGGIVAGDDYYMTRAGNLGVIQAAQEYADAHNYELHSTLWDLTQEVVDNQQPAWWFEK